MVVHIKFSPLKNVLKKITFGVLEKSPFVFVELGVSESLKVAHCANLGTQLYLLKIHIALKSEF